MKNLVYLSFFACLFFVSCAGDEFAGVEESQSFNELATYYNQIDEWSPTALSALEGVSFDLETAESTYQNACGQETTTTTTTSGLHSTAGTDMNSFSQAIGFESIHSFNTWFIDFGKHYYDLVIEHRPSDKEAFVNYISDQHVADPCAQAYMQTLSYRAYEVGKNFGVRTNVGGQRQQAAIDLYGIRSPIFYANSMLQSKSACIGSE